MQSAINLSKTFLIILLLSYATLIKSQTKNNYDIKLQYVHGTILKHTNHLQNLVQDPVMGAELAIEWQTLGEKDWHQHIWYPKVGLGLVALDLGNPSMLGGAYAIYPYLNFRLFQFGRFTANLKGGAGVSFLTKTFNNTATDLNNLNSGNAAIGSVVNVYFAGGVNFNLPLELGFSLVADMQWNHASNGSFYQPNSGINMINGSFGISYTPFYKHGYHPRRKSIQDLSQKLSFELIVSGGGRELYYKDNAFYPTGSIVAALYKPLGNAFRLGIGVDGFYDGVYNGKTLFKRTYITDDQLSNKIRVGLSVRPELVFGRFTAGIHMGLYVYNPIKNLEPYDEAKTENLNKPLIYKYNIEQEDGWFYTRAALQYAITKNVLFSLGLKTHLQKAEFIEWGIGYRFK